MGLKSKLHQHCVAYIDRRIETARQAIAEAQASADEETKSSAGDKYETGRAMMQLEMEKHATQLEESLKLRRALESIDVHGAFEQVSQGSVVQTDRANFYLAISAGTVDVNGKSYMTISSGSPIGTKMTGLKAGDIFQMNTTSYKILHVD